MSEDSLSPNRSPADAELFQNAPCGLIVTDQTGWIAEINNTMCCWLGFSREDVVGRKRFVDLLSPGGRIYHETHYMRLLELQGRAREIAFEIVRADGERVPVLVNSVMESGPAGAVVRSAVFDATERRGYETELLHQKKRAEDSEARSRELLDTLRQVLMPRLPRIEPFEVGVGFRPAGDGSEIGGDFFDLFPVGSGQWILVVADVQGKGVQAATLTAVARYAIRAAAVNDTSPASIATTLNEVLLHHENRRTATAVICRLSPTPNGTLLALSVAGHPLPLKRTVSGEVSPMAGYGLLLGALPEPGYRDHEAVLFEGETMVIYTDGITEGRRNGVFFGEERLIRAIESGEGDPSGLVAGLVRDAVEYQGERPQDDLTVVALANRIAR